VFVHPSIHRPVGPKGHVCVCVSPNDVRRASTTEANDRKKSNKAERRVPSVHFHAAPRSMNLGIACAADSVLARDNWLLLEAFTGRGHTARIVVWDYAAVDTPAAWQGFDLVVVRTCWSPTFFSSIRRISQVRLHALPPPPFCTCSFLCVCGRSDDNKKGGGSSSNT